MTVIEFVSWTVTLVIFAFMTIFQRSLLAAGLYAFVFPFWLNAIDAL